jgi:hypothetical protein
MPPTPAEIRRYIAALYPFPGPAPHQPLRPDRRRAVRGRARLTAEVEAEEQRAETALQDFTTLQAAHRGGDLPPEAVLRTRRSGSAIAAPAPRAARRVKR